MAKIKTEPPVSMLRYEVGGIALLALAAISAVGFFLEYSPGAYAVPPVGTLGRILLGVARTVAGNGRYFLVALLVYWGVLLLRRQPERLKSGFGGSAVAYLVVLTTIHFQLIRFAPASTALRLGLSGQGGGFFGALGAVVIYVLFGGVGGYIVLGALMLVGLMLVTGLSVGELSRRGRGGMGRAVGRCRSGLANFLFTEDEEFPHGETSLEEKAVVKKPARKRKKDKIPYLEDSGYEVTGEEDLETDEPKEFEVLPVLEDSLEERAAIYPQEQTPVVIEHALVSRTAGVSRTAKTYEDYVLPPATLLTHRVRLRSQRLNRDIHDKAQHLEETLESFGVKIKVNQVSRGPSVTRFEVQPAPGVKVSRIVGLADDIALSMAAPHVRIEAPIPGKAAVGIEVPNKEIAMVHFREVLETTDFQESPSLLTVALGKDIAGNPVVADLARMPHLLIAGATGAGKSVCINSLVVSLLFRARPSELKFLMIDPKVVELTTYNGIPHLLAPVVTEPKKAATALRWIVSEMENRYEAFAAAGVKDIERYNQAKARENPNETKLALPYVVVIIDELADLMMVAPSDVEDAICRLAQMARAAGIHLVVATQRPSVDVITGLIKANIPTRVAFAVSSQIDSRTILDMGGAEKLLGRGDMLFLPVGASKPIRVQGAYVSDQEVDAIVGFLCLQGKPDYEGGGVKPEFIPAEVEETIPDDALLADAVRVLLENGQASISMLQRRLRVGYTRAARLMDIMEARGIVGSYEGSKPRNILIGWDDYKRMFGSQALKF